MTALLASLVKEMRLLLRDWHALLVLFLMPALFIVIMSLALAERLGGEANFQLKGYLVQQASGPEAEALAGELTATTHLALTPGDAGAELRLGERAFAIRLLPGFDEALNTPGATGIEVSFAPELGARERELVLAATRQAFANVYTGLIAEELGYDQQYAREELLREAFVASVSEHQHTPNAVQQNVPGWLIFAMFFIAIPLSTTVIQERSERTLMRLRTMGASLPVIYAAKLLPYFVVNMLQLVLMLALGSLLLPLLGAVGLSLAVNLPALLFIGVCTSLAALALASLVATVARTVEQATVASGGLNILLAALGGIMIPAFVMPPALQAITRLSPMNWALSGFLEVLVRGGGMIEAAPWGAALLLLAAVLWGLAAVLLKKE